MNCMVKACAASGERINKIRTRMEYMSVVDDLAIKVNDDIMEEEVQRFISSLDESISSLEEAIRNEKSKKATATMPTAPEENK